MGCAVAAAHPWVRRLVASRTVPDRNHAPAVSCRPRAGGRVAAGRSFGCRRCGAIVVLCVACYRGHLYCDSCRGPARTASRARARLTYAKSPEGILGNADRQRDWRQRRQEARTVTDHGSAPPSLEATVGASGTPPDLEVSVVEPAPPSVVAESAAAPAAEPRRIPSREAPIGTLRCHCCGTAVRGLLRPGARRPLRRPSG